MISRFRRLIEVFVVIKKVFDCMTFFQMPANDRDDDSEMEVKIHVFESLPTNESRWKIFFFLP